ncbi:RraA family protein [Oricola sp.]
MDDALLEFLKSVDTPTVCNAIETAQGKRGFSAFTRRPVIVADRDARPIVGFASTGKVASKFPSPETPESVRERRLGYYRHMATSPKPAIAVIEDIDYPECLGAFWGEVNATVHKGLGLSGAITNGLVRDLGSLPADFPILAGSVGPSRAFVHVTGFGMPVEIFGMPVKQGDLIHADQHGAIVIPPDVVSGLRDAVRTVLEAEKVVLETARKPDFDIDMLVDAWTRFEDTRNG